MIKKELVQLVMDSAGLEFGDRSVQRQIGLAFTTIVGQLFGRDGNQYGFYTKRVPLVVDHRVATLSVPLIQNAFNSKGVVRVMPTGADSTCLPDRTVFYPAPSYALQSGADANKLSGIVFYTVTANVIRFNESLPDAVTALVADVVPEFSAWDDEDFIPMPAGVAQMIIDSAVAAIKGQPGHINIFKKKS